MCQPITNRDSIQKYIDCFDSYVRATIQEFKIPDADAEFLVKKLIVTLSFKEGEFVAFNQIGISFESKIGEKTMMEFINEPCVDIFTKAKEKKVRKGEKVVRVYEYFLEGPKKYFSRDKREKLVKRYYDQEVEKELKKLKRSGNVLDVSYQLMTVGYPKF